MKPEAQRIAIAEACGWRRVAPKSDLGWGADADKNKCWMYPHQLPNYLKNLNAMRDAESSLDDELGCQWMDCLSLVIHGHEGHRTINMMQATAAQRAEAFLRTIGKWQEQPQEQTA